MSELAYTSARDLAAQIRSGDPSSREATEHLLARVEKLDGPINAVVTIDAERARSVPS